jgi:DNA repair exonuclease SbcCD ATPase subunit
MTSAEHSQLNSGMGCASEETAVQSAELVAVSPIGVASLGCEQKIEELKELKEKLRQLGPDYASRRRSQLALAKATETLLPIEEICQGLADVADTTEQLDQQVMLLEEGRKMERRARRLESLRAARQAPRCEHIKSNAQRCGSPAVGGQKFCFFHNLARGGAVEFPVLEDRRALQIAILRVCERLANGTIAPANAKVLLEGLTMASKNAERMVCEEEG